VKKLKVIVVLYEPPYPFGRAPSRWYYVLLRELARDGHKVVCFCAYENKKEVEEARKFFPEGLVDLRFFPFPERKRNIFQKVKSILVPSKYYFSDNFINEYEREIKKGYDILHIEQNWAGYLGLEYKRSIVSIHYLMSIDMENSLPKDLKERIIKHQMLRRERKLLSRYKNIRVLTERLKRKVSEINPSANIFTLPLAVDHTLYPMSPFQDNNKIFGMIGSILWSPGYSAAMTLLKDIFPRVKQRVKEAKLLIAGWGAEEKLSQFKGNDIIIKGNVESPEEFFSKASVLVYCPSRGSGMKVKVMESMLYGIPVVTNSEGIEGLEVENGRHCFFSGNLDCLVDNIVDLINDDNLKKKLREEARSLIEKRYSPEAIMPEVYKIYKNIIEMNT